MEGQWGRPSVDDVAEAAGMKKANVFHYYPDKDKLGQAVFESGSRFMKEQFSSSLAQGKGDPLRAVESLFNNMICDMDKNCCSGGCFIGNTAQEMSDENETLRQRIALHLQDWTRELKDLFSHHRGSGYFRPTLDPEASAQAVLSLYEGAVLLSKAARNTRALENARRMALEYLQIHRT
jgi:TetR/AcrR family transcriptional repressor of nem operon